MKDTAPGPWLVVSTQPNPLIACQWFDVIDGDKRILAHIYPPDYDGHDTGVPRLARLLASAKLMHLLLKEFEADSDDSDGIIVGHWREVEDFIEGRRALPPQEWPYA